MYISHNGLRYQPGEYLPAPQSNAPLSDIKTEHVVMQLVMNSNQHEDRILMHDSKLISIENTIKDFVDFMEFVRVREPGILEDYHKYKFATAKLEQSTGPVTFSTVA